MNMLRLKNPVWNTADAGSGGGPTSSPSTPTGTPAPASSAPPAPVDGAAPAGQQSYMAQMRNQAQQATQDPAGQQPAPGNTEPQGQGDTAPDGSSEFKLDVPQEMAEYAPDFEAYQGAAAQWIKDNPQATAADALKFAAEYQAKRVGDLTQQLQQQHQETVSSWETTARADKEFGGDRFNENLAIAKTAIEKFATPELKQMLDETGVGNHPEMIRAFYRAGKLLQEAPVIGTTTGTGRKTLTQALYGNS